MLRFLTDGWLERNRSDQLRNIGLLALRLSFGGMMFFSHGLGKLLSFGEKYTSFPDPLGISSPVSMTLAVGAEAVCSLALIFGFATRLTCIPLIITMLVAAFIVHGADPFTKQEFALMYCFGFLTLLFTGAGQYSVDAMLDRKSGDK